MTLVDPVVNVMVLMISMVYVMFPVPRSGSSITRH